MLRGTGGGRRLMLCGHMDVVGALPEQFVPEVRDGRLYGRGAYDMKGGIGAMVFAAETLAALGLRLAGDLIVNTNTDEESSGAGSIACVDHGVRADAGICTEPTSGEVWVCTRGSQSVTITVEGRAGHAELRHPGWREGGPVNAIDAAEPVLAAIRDLRAEWAGRPDLAQPPGLSGTLWK
jgi:acetylornithine deacetylase